jgi:hypothetical protein
MVHERKYIILPAKLERETNVSSRLHRLATPKTYETTPNNLDFSPS